MNNLIDFVQKHNKECGIDALFISNFYNILYLTGFKTLSPHEREAFLLITQKNAYLFSDGRYHENFKAQNSDSIEYRLLTSEKSLKKHLEEIVYEEGITKLGFEREDLKFYEYEVFQKSLSVELVPQDKTILKMRMVKQRREIEYIEKACRGGDMCLKDIVPLIKVGITEKEIAWKIEKWIREKGYEVAFDPIVAIDASSALPHYDTQSGNGYVKNRSIILIDMGVKYQGYNSDITRMFFMGSQPDEVRRVYQTLLDAQVKTIQHISKAKKLSEIDVFCRNKVTVSDYSHSTGHGIGLEVHEYPKISSLSQDVLKVGSVFTIEPGIYIPGRWGMRIEDTVAIETSDQILVLTRYPKELCLL